MDPSSYSSAQGPLPETGGEESSIQPQVTVGRGRRGTGTVPGPVAAPPPSSSSDHFNPYFSHASTSIRIPTPPEPRTRRSMNTTSEPILSPVTRLIPSRPRRSKPSGLAVLRLVLRTTQGREESLRLTQFILRLLVYLQGYHPSSDGKPKTKTARLLLFVSVISTARKCLSIFDFLEPLNDLSDLFYQTFSSASASTSSHSNGEAVESVPISKKVLKTSLTSTDIVLDFLNGLADDVECFGRLGLTTTSIRSRACRYSDVLTLLGTLVKLTMLEMDRRETWLKGRAIRRRMYEIEREEVDLEMGKEDFERQEGEFEVLRRYKRSLKALRGRLNTLWWERLGLYADLLFVVYDVFEWKRGSEGARAIAGCLSACIGFTHTWHEVRRSITVS